MYLRILNLKKEIGIAMKSKETSSHLKPVRNNSYVATYYKPACS